MDFALTQAVKVGAGKGDFIVKAISQPPELRPNSALNARCEALGAMPVTARDHHAIFFNFKDHHV